ncbi:hypothetical protein GF359_06265 [candidate division WOR-3 bacterium]|uniref:T9SS type A sorting domain-containing protein n=1 Tax=candidate division WOR-3 bacterium TaxID=2052148 RepID=A0A9D5K989_UNCW3|nr:hypothetical protein [candidate division WOR-3 bacterium]MBD3364803.1 hypothetical protein [candidate division WOR-3 bacterium]
MINLYTILITLVISSSVNTPAEPSSRNVAEIARYGLTGTIKSVFVSEPYLYAADLYEGLRIIDISNPVNPCEVGFCETASMALDVCVSGFYAYLANWDKLSVINVGSPSNPHLAGNCKLDANNVCVCGNNAYVSSNAWEDGFKVVNISNPSNPVQISTHPATAWATDVCCGGSFAYVAASYVNMGGIQVMDVSNPQNPVEVGYYTAPEGPSGVYHCGSYIYVAAGGAGLRIVDITRPERPEEKSSCTTPEDAYSICVEGSYAYVVGDMLRIIDIKNPEYPLEVGYCDIEATAVCVAEPYIFTAEGENGIGIYENLVLGTEEDNIPVPGLKFFPSLNRLGYRINGKAILTVYSASGVRISTQTVDGNGFWTPSPELPDGVYFARLEGGYEETCAKVVVLR